MKWESKKKIFTSVEMARQFDWRCALGLLVDVNEPTKRFLETSLGRSPVLGLESSNTGILVLVCTLLLMIVWKLDEEINLNWISIKIEKILKIENLNWNKFELKWIWKSIWIEYQSIWIEYQFK